MILSPYFIIVKSRSWFEYFSTSLFQPLGSHIRPLFASSPAVNCNILEELLKL